MVVGSALHRSSRRPVAAAATISLQICLVLLLSEPARSPLLPRPPASSRSLRRMPPRRDQRHCARALLPLLAWLCAALSLRYGYYGSNHLALGPNSSRMMMTSSLFVEQLQVKDEAGQGLLLYGFNDRPQLGSETNWTISSDLFVDIYSRQGFSMWLNRGSRIWMAWQVAYGGESYADMLVVLIKGEQNLEELERYSPDDMGNSRDGSGSNREFSVAEDGMYYLGVVNLSLRSITMNMNIKIASKMYDTSKATSICSTSNGECKLKLLFPNAQYYVLATSDSEVPLKVWHIQLSFVARLTSYFVVTGVLVVIVSVILKHLGACCVEQTRREQGVEAAAAAETQPIAPRKEMACGYGATEEEAESSVCCAAEDLYDGKICVICYDERRSCFFTPCGHSVACCSCAQRVMEEQSKVCPICRRLIHKWRRLPGL